MATLFGIAYSNTLITVKWTILNNFFPYLVIVFYSRVTRESFLEYALNSFVISYFVSR